MKQLFLVFLVLILTGCYSSKVKLKKGTIGIGIEKNKAFPILVPYDVCMRSSDSAYGIISKPEYFDKVVELKKNSFTPLELCSFLSQATNTEVKIEGRITSDKRWNYKLYFAKEKYSFGYVLQELISHLHELGIPSKNIEDWNKNNKDKIVDFMPVHRVYAELHPQKIIIKLLIIGEIKD
jgi:hypothetical protein